MENKEEEDGVVGDSGADPDGRWLAPGAPPGTVERFHGRVQAPPMHEAFYGSAIMRGNHGHEGSSDGPVVDTV